MQAAQIASKDSPEKVFLEKVTTIWFAYFLVKRAAENQVTFEGKAICRKVIDELNGASLEVWKSRAEQLTDKISLALQDKVRDALSGPRKRARRTPAYVSFASLGLIRCIGNNDSLGDSSGATSPPLINADVFHQSHGLDAREDLPRNLPVDSSDHVLLDPHLAKASTFFPSHLSGGIKRGPAAGNRTLLVARISMIFPLAPVAYQKPRVVMTIEIMDNKVEHTLPVYCLECI